MEINPLFSSTHYNETGIAKVAVIRRLFSGLVEDLEGIIPGGSRELSIIKSNLEEACFYAVKAVRNYKENLA